jgi:hypothetical protein
MRVVVTGSRDWRDGRAIQRALAALIDRAPVTIVHGDARGADRLADHAAHVLERWGYRVERFPADWRTHGRAAGPIRNRQMLEAGADAVFAFPMPGSRGTLDCMIEAHRRGIPVWIWTAERMKRWGPHEEDTLMSRTPEDEEEHLPPDDEEQEIENEEEAEPSAPKHPK